MFVVKLHSLLWLHFLFYSYIFLKLIIILLIFHEPNLCKFSDINIKLLFLCTDVITCQFCCCFVLFFLGDITSGVLHLSIQLLLTGWDYSWLWSWNFSLLLAWKFSLFSPTWNTFVSLFLSLLLCVSKGRSSVAPCQRTRRR